MSYPTTSMHTNSPTAPRDRLATELAAMTLLHDISTRFVQEGNTRSLFRQIVIAALEITGADMGNIHILDEASGQLEMVACCNHGMVMPECCKQADKRTAVCGAVSLRAERLVIEDLGRSPGIAGVSFDALLSAGVKSIQSTPLFTRSGRLIGVLSTHCRNARRVEENDLRLLEMLARQLADIIEQSQAAEALKKSTERHRCLFDNLLDGYAHCRMIFQGDTPVDFEFLAVNPAFEKLTGLKEVVGRRASEVIPGVETDNPELLRTFGEVAQAGEPARFETYISALGKWFSFAVYRPADGEMVAVFDNISERKRLETELQKRRSEMESLHKQQVAAQTAASIAHDLNQPLVAISAYSEVALRMLKNGDTGSGKLARAIEGCFAQAQRAGQTLHELLDFLHNGESVFSPMDLGEALRDVVAFAQASGYGRFRPVFELEPGLPPVQANRVQIQKVLDNLLRNGIDAMAETGVSDPVITITARTMDERKMAQITVRDNGPGFDGDMARRVFEPFFTTKSEGIGLGLAISRTLIQAHGGQLWADREARPGASFHFTLPFAP